jgi:broad specificity phosphatase PhoE
LRQSFIPLSQDQTKKIEAEASKNGKSIKTVFAMFVSSPRKRANKKTNELLAAALLIPLLWGLVLAGDVGVVRSAAWLYIGVD